jgi:diketogulonate reductase-like aldo/keto reductase
MRTVALPSGERVPALGQGTWKMGERAGERAAEVAALRLGLDLGLTLLDTAEMYGDGGAEDVVGEAVAGRRESCFIVSKVYPHNASRRGTVAACERSLARLRTDRIDLYLLHWRGRVPLAETVEAFERLREAGKIRHWGVSNFDRSDMEELHALKAGARVAADQVLYNPKRRGPEWDLLPWCHEHGVPVMAYSPIDQGGALLRARPLRAVAARLGASPAQVVLAWLLARPGVIVVPKAVRATHVRENRAALDLALDAAALEALESAFPPPSGPVPLEIV